MTHAERDHLLERIEELEYSQRCWKRVAWLLGVACFVLLLLDGWAIVVHKQLVQTRAQLAENEAKAQEMHEMALRQREVAEHALQLHLFSTGGPPAPAHSTQMQRP